MSTDVTNPLSESTLPDTSTVDFHFDVLCP